MSLPRISLVRNLFLRFFLIEYFQYKNNHQHIEYRFYEIIKKKIQIIFSRIVNHYQCGWSKNVIINPGTPLLSCIES